MAGNLRRKWIDFKAVPAQFARLNSFELRCSRRPPPMCGQQFGGRGTMPLSLLYLIRLMRGLVKYARRLRSASGDCSWAASPASFSSMARRVDQGLMPLMKQIMAHRGLDGCGTASLGSASFLHLHTVTTAEAQGESQPLNGCRRPAHVVMDGADRQPRGTAERAWASPLAPMP